MLDDLSVEFVVTNVNTGSIGQEEAIIIIEILVGMRIRNVLEPGWKILVESFDCRIVVELCRVVGG